MLDEEFQALALKTLAGDAVPAEEDALRSEVSSSEERREEYAILAETLGALRQAAPALHAITDDMCVQEESFSLPSWRASELSAAVRMHFQKPSSVPERMPIASSMEESLFASGNGSRTIRPNPFVRRRQEKAGHPEFPIEVIKPRYLAPEELLSKKLEEQPAQQQQSQPVPGQPPAQSESSDFTELFRPGQNKAALSAAAAGVSAAFESSASASSPRSRLKAPAMTLWSRMRRPLATTLQLTGFRRFDAGADSGISARDSELNARAEAYNRRLDRENTGARRGLFAAWMWPWLTVGFACIALMVTRMSMNLPDPAMGSIEIGLFSEPVVRGSQTNVRAPAVPVVRVRMFQTNNDFEKWLASRPESDVKVRIWLDEAENLIRISRPSTLLAGPTEETRPLPLDPIAREEALKNVVAELSQ
ncbi:MAG: hypothetical protein ACAI35_18425 [Candidatus Methylacidiphilales bacterium]|nr:hypothetical protein [Candidatus Methylacidiphilales bacterium]